MVAHDPNAVIAEARCPAFSHDKLTPSATSHAERGRKSNPTLFCLLPYFDAKAEEPNENPLHLLWWRLSFPTKPQIAERSRVAALRP